MDIRSAGRGGQWNYTSHRNHSWTENQVCTCALQHSFLPNTGRWVVIRLCQSGVCLNTRSSCSNPITEGGRREGEKVVTCTFLKAGSIWKLRGFIWYQQRAVRVLFPTPHPSSMAHLNLLPWELVQGRIALWSKEQHLGSDFLAPSSCFQLFAFGKIT